MNITLAAKCAADEKILIDIERAVILYKLYPSLRVSIGLIQKWERRIAL